MMRMFSVRYLLAVAVVVALSGCAAAGLREAQDHFNTAAEMEARALDASLLADNAGAHPGDSVSALNEYRLAYATASEAIAKKGDELRRDRLLGATYVLKAMALWRISDLQGDPLQDNERTSTSEASAQGTAPSAANARQELLALLEEIGRLHEAGEIFLGTRDRVLHRALYGFYDHDGGRAAADYATAQSWFESALKQLDDAVAGEVPPAHAVRVYVGAAQLRTLAAWNQAVRAEFEACKADPAHTKKQCRDAKTPREDMVNARTQAVACKLEPFWSGNPPLKNQLEKLLAVIGLLSAMDNC